MALKGQDGLVKRYAMVNVQQYQIVETGGTVAECETNYRRALAESNLIREEQAEIEQPETDMTELGVVIQEIRSAVISGNTNFFLYTDTPGGSGKRMVFRISASAAPQAVLMDAGDPVIVTYDQKQTPENAGDAVIYQAETVTIYDAVWDPADTGTPSETPEEPAPEPQEQPVEDFSIETPAA